MTKVNNKRKSSNETNETNNFVKFMSLDDKSQQITQITQKIKSVKSVQSVDNKRKFCGGLFVLHELVGLCHTVIEFAMAIHVNLCLDRLLQSLQKRLYGLQEGDIGAC